MAKYGISYMGSKDQIVVELASRFPRMDNFYDLFGGGFSVTHYMLLHRSKQYKHFYFNELESSTVELIKDAIAGKYNYDVFRPPWVSREEFFAKKDTCAYTRIIWSFGNCQRTYIFGKDIEEEKCSLHQAVIFNEFNETATTLLGLSKFHNRLTIPQRRIFCRRKLSTLRLSTSGKYEMQRLQQLERMQHLQRLERMQQLQHLQQLQQLQQLNFSSKSYDQVDIKPNSLIYCDPPYKGTGEYTTTFNHNKFYEWARSVSEPMLISEYFMPSDFKLVASISKKTRISPKGCIDTKPEKLFCNKAYLDLIYRK